MPSLQSKPLGTRLMVGKTTTVRPVDQVRFDDLQAMGCIICILYFKEWNTPGQIDHILDPATGNRYKDQEHQHTICMTPWHHMGTPPSVSSGGIVLQLNATQARARFGPSKARHPAEFHALYGSDQELLEMTNTLLAAYRDPSWHHPGE